MGSKISNYIQIIYYILYKNYYKGNIMFCKVIINYRRFVIILQVIKILIYVEYTQVFWDSRAEKSKNGQRNFSVLKKPSQYIKPN